MGRLDLSSAGLQDLLAHEWLATCGNGAFASSTICGANTRKYHGLLIASMSPPVRRMVLLSRVEETVHCNGASDDLACNEYPGVFHPQGHRLLRAFNDNPFPRWAYQGDGWTIEKQLRPIEGQNTILLTYTLLGGTQQVEMDLRPLFALRGMHELMYQWNGPLDAQSLSKQHHRIPATSRSPEAFFAHDGTFSQQPCWYLNTIYTREKERGYAGLEDLWMPGVIRYQLLPGHSVHFACSADPIDLPRIISFADAAYEAAAGDVAPAADPKLDALLRAARRFIVRTVDGKPMIMAGYPWSAPSGRDAMICLPGLLLAPGRMNEARELLLSFAALVKDGLMPTELAEDGSGYSYAGADTSLWFIHAVHEYMRYGGNEAFVLSALLPAIDAIIDGYRRGTALGIGMDSDCLLRSGVPGTATTWMDAKVDDVLVCARAGKAVCLNALWYNALRVAADLAARAGHDARCVELTIIADRLQDAFNRTFWNDSAGCCFDSIADQPDSAIRPNQIFAVSLPYPVLDISRHATLVEKVESVLLTPYGVRTLAPDDKGYHGHYRGSPAERDRAHYQGCAFPWLLGPLTRAYIRVHGRGEPSRAHAAQILQPCLELLMDVGHLGELFDGDPPHQGGGAVASARSTAEVLRAYAEDILEIVPRTSAGGGGSAGASFSITPLKDDQPALEPEKP